MLLSLILLSYMVVPISELANTLFLVILSTTYYEIQKFELKKEKALIIQQLSNGVLG